MPAAITVISRAPAPAGSNVWRAAIICSASISAHFVTPEVHFRSAFGPDLVSGAAAGLLLRLSAPAPDAGVGELHDLEQVDHVHRGADRDQAERDRGEGRPRVPHAVLAEGDEAGSERRGGQRDDPEV